jgi:hypothetical protein
MQQINRSNGLASQASEPDAKLVREALSLALERWVRHEDERALARWLARELDGDGAPVRLGISQWQECALALLDAERTRGPLPSACLTPVSKLIRSALRFSRPDGSAVTEFGGAAAGPPRRRRLRWLAKHLFAASAARARPGETSVAEGRGRPDALAAWASSDQVLASLWDDGEATGDFLAVDHRDPAAPCRFEIFGAGRSWLGPGWTIGTESVPTSRPRPRQCVSTAAADLVEWTYRGGAARYTQSALLLRGRGLALVAVLAEVASAPGQRVELRVSRPSIVAAEAVKDTRAFLLTTPKKRASAHILPIALPCVSYPTDRGAFLVEGNEFVLNLAAGARRTWLPLLISWDAKRHRKIPKWRSLTISERSRIVPPDTAFAARVSWGRNETYVIYRSLGRPGTRAFLGHHTRARFLVGRFTRSGDVEPILKVD